MAAVVKIIHLPLHLQALKLQTLVRTRALTQMFQAVPHKEIAAVPQAQAVLAAPAQVAPAVLALAPVQVVRSQAQVAQVAPAVQVAPAALQCQPPHLCQLLLHLLQN